MGILLGLDTLDRLPASVGRPRYDRQAVEAGIIHLGVGAFHRAHQAAYTEAVLASGDLRWGIVGASVLSAKMKSALVPQDGLYVLAERGADGEKLSVIGAIIELLGGVEDAATLLQRMSAPTTRIVSITVTEKGYFLDPASGSLRIDAPEIAADLAAPQQPRTILGFIVRALQLRKEAGIAPFTVLSCDNLPSNGKLAKAAVLAYARHIDAALADWIERNGAFPCSMVDRITPATTDADREHIATAIGMQDAWPVVTEAFSQWVIEDSFTLGRPDWTLGGAVFSNEIDRWEDMKLRCLNGAHSTLAYLGQLAGCETVLDAMNSPYIAAALDALWLEVCAVLHAPQGVDPADYVKQLQARFRNPALKHRTAQIACDGSQKLPQRLLAPLRDRLAQDLPVPALALAVAGWMHFVVKTAHTPGAALSDPLSETILAAARRECEADRIVEALLAIRAIFGDDLPAHPGFVAELKRQFRALAVRPEVATAAQIAL